MRAWLLMAFVLIGCLPRPVPALDSKQAAYAAAQVLWRSYLRSGEYDEAAKVASEQRLGPMEIGIALRLARTDAKKRRAAYNRAAYGEDSDALREEMVKAYGRLVKIACVYGPSKLRSPGLAVRAVQVAHDDVDDDALRYLLLDHGCPLDQETRFEIIAAAVTDGLDEYALAFALRSDWNTHFKMNFVKMYLVAGQCSFGFLAAARLDIGPDDLETMFQMAVCDDEAFDTSGWSFSQANHRRFFFAAVKARKYHLALEFNRLSLNGENDVWYLLEEMFRRSDFYQTQTLLKLHPGLREKMYAYALGHGHARFVGMQTSEIVWEERAFEKLLETGKYEDAAEVAEFGPSLTMRTEGVLKAFRAAAAAGDFVVARYLWNRYQAIVPQVEYEKARSAWNKAHPRDRRFRGPRKLPKRPKDPDCIPTDPGGWTVKRCD